MGINIGKDGSGRITVRFQYDPSLVQKAKAIEGYKWHPVGKYWSYPADKGTLTQIRTAFEGEEIFVAPVLRIEFPRS